MKEFLASVIVILMVMPILGIVLSRFSKQEQRWMLLAFAFQIVATLAQIWVHLYYYGYGDMLSYHREGMYLANLMRDDFVTYGPDVWRILIQREPQSSVWVHGIGRSTGSMSALGGFLTLITFDSLYASCFIVSFLAFFGLLALYAGLKTGVPRELHRRLFVACLFIPSVIFWSSGLQKESVAVAGMGFATLSLYELIDRHRMVRGSFLLMGGVVLMALSKAYLLVPFALSTTAWMVIYFARKSNRDITAFAGPGYAMLGLFFAVGSMIIIGEIFPRYSIANFAAEASHMQQVGARIEGGSNYVIVEEPAAQLTIAQQLMNAPVAMVTALFRPFIFEARNPFSLLSALEATAAMLLLVMAFKRRGVAASWRRVLGSPSLAYCLIFVLLVSLGVGLTTTNMGTLSRYRIPMIPMYFVLVLMLLPRKPRRFVKAVRP